MGVGGWVGGVVVVVVVGWVCGCGCGWWWVGGWGWGGGRWGGRAAGGPACRLPRPRPAAPLQVWECLRRAGACAALLPFDRAPFSMSSVLCALCCRLFYGGRRALPRRVRQGQGGAPQVRAAQQRHPCAPQASGAPAAAAAQQRRCHGLRLAAAGVWGRSAAAAAAAGPVLAQQRQQRACDRLAATTPHRRHSIPACLPTVLYTLIWNFERLSRETRQLATCTLQFLKPRPSRGLLQGPLQTLLQPILLPVVTPNPSLVHASAPFTLVPSSSPLPPPVPDRRPPCMRPFIPVASAAARVPFHPLADMQQTHAKRQRKRQG